ncbi:MerR family transcriptional regulator [Oceanirhabdus sp. W0125-5]|nr:MerR family transcriptional regulator [Oceanirhabdus sp. W0125-5]WBW96558.1 MerR family transcriptional regulator [Oceanirhabdus sp. W0125-5]
MAKLISMSEVCKFTEVTIMTLKVWDNEGTLKAKYMTAGARE